MKSSTNEKIQSYCNKALSFYSSQEIQLSMQQQSPSNNGNIGSNNNSHEKLFFKKSREDFQESNLVLSVHDPASLPSPGSIPAKKSEKSTTFASEEAQDPLTLEKKKGSSSILNKILKRKT